jgi:hypothetical protein
MTSPCSSHWQTTLPAGQQARVAVRPIATNLLVGDGSTSFTFDSAGRLHAAFFGGRNYRRSLDNRMMVKWTERHPTARERWRRWLAQPEARTVAEIAYKAILDVLAVSASAPPEVQAALAKIKLWDWAALQQDRDRFQQIYTPIGILPPDQYLALVLQATQGCSHNACTFCTFYRGLPFRIKSPAEFQAHLAAVLDFFGSALAMRRSIFLADANALVVPMQQLLAFLDVLAEVPQLAPQGPAGRPLFAFIDAFHVERKSVSDWQELRERGLRRVYIGMESGHDPLLRWLNKPGDAGAVLDAVTTLKAAGLNASVIVMLGVGGDCYAHGHVADTLRLLNAMPLARGDLIYISDFRQLPDAPYNELATSQGIQPLSQPAIRAQEAAIRAGYQPHDPTDPPQFSRYDIDEFIY